MKKTTGYFRLMRPANVVTSVADALAGMAISGYLFAFIFNVNHIVPILLLCIAAIGLYGGGVVFNDVFDARLDSVERPERPIPSGLIPVNKAAQLGILLLLIGIIAAFITSALSGFIAVLVAISALVYNKWGKHHSHIGPLNMGLCRGLNLLLGISIIPPEVFNWYYLAFVPIIYIASITMISRGEVHGSGRKPLYLAVVLYSLVIVAICYFAFRKGNVLFSLLFILPFAWMIFKPLVSAIKEPVGKNIGKAVKAGVLALILMNAAWAAAFGALVTAIIIICLLPVSLWLASKFAVT